MPWRRGIFPRNVRFGDIVRGLPIAAGSCDVAYCSHMLEHLALADFRAALRNTFTILRPGGTFRLVVPDLAQCVRAYAGGTDPQAAHRFMVDTHLGHQARSRGLRGALVAWLGNSRHLWMWDEPAMRAELDAAGFVDARRASFGDSPDSMFALVEDAGRFTGCLAMECRKSRA